MKAPDLYTITIVEGNAGGITPGVYVRIDDLVPWLEHRKLKKTAQALRDQAVDGISRDVKYGTIGRGRG